MWQKSVRNFTVWWGGNFRPYQGRPNAPCPVNCPLTTKCQEIQVYGSLLLAPNFGQRTGLCSHKTEDTRTSPLDKLTIYWSLLYLPWYKEHGGKAHCNDVRS